MSAECPRLLFRVDPLPLESPRGYLSRVAHEHGYHGPLAIAQIAGLQRTNLERDEDASLIAYVLRLEPEEWRSMRYRPIRGKDRFFQRSFCGHSITADALHYDRTRVCPGCLGERAVWWAVWDLGLVSACPHHRCHLIDQCLECGRALRWRRASISRCRCGADLRRAPADPAPRDLLAIQAAIYRAAGTELGTQAREDLAAAGFAPELHRLNLGSLLRLVVFAGSIGEEGRLRSKQRPFSGTDLTAAKRIGREAAALFSNWPRPFHEVLRRMLPPRAHDPSTLNFSRIYGNFYRHLFRVLPPAESAFLREEFEQFVVADWRGLIRGNHRYFSASVHAQSHWVCSNEAEKLARTTSNRIAELVRAKQVDGVFVNALSRVECWVRRESLRNWIAKRDAEVARYMLRPEVETVLGLTHLTATVVAEAGAIRYVRGPSHDFPAGSMYFLREDVLLIRDAFGRHAAPMLDYSGPGSLVTLRHAVKNFLGRGPGLAAVVRAVVDGVLAPVGRTHRFRGIMGYLFRVDDLRVYRPLGERTDSRETFLNFREAATILNVKTVVVRALVQHGVFPVVPGHINGLSKLIRESEVQAFADTYVLASRRGTTDVEVDAEPDRLRIRIPEAGRGFVIFVPAHNKDSTRPHRTYERSNSAIF